MIVFGSPAVWLRFADEDVSKPFFGSILKRQSLWQRKIGYSGYVVNRVMRRVGKGKWCEGEKEETWWKMAHMWKTERKTDQYERVFYSLEGTESAPFII